MKKTHRYRIVLAFLAACGVLSGCNAQREASAEAGNLTAEAAVSPTAALTPTSTPTPTPTPSPSPAPEFLTDEDRVKYETEDEKMILYLPDKSWENVSDQDGIRLFESEDVGNITILHGTREELPDFTIPDSEKAVKKFYKDNDVSERDFQILEYVNNSIGDVGIYRYALKFQEDSGFEYVYSANYVVVVDDEIYSISGTVREDDLNLFKKVKTSVESLQICQTDAMAEEESGGAAEEILDEGNEEDGGTSEDYSENPQFVQEEQGGDS